MKSGVKDDLRNFENQPRSMTGLSPSPSGLFFCCRLFFYCIVVPAGELIPRSPLYYPFWHLWFYQGPSVIRVRTFSHIALSFESQSWKVDGIDIRSALIMAHSKFSYFAARTLCISDCWQAIGLVNRERRAGIRSHRPRWYREGNWCYG